MARRDARHQLEVKLHRLLRSTLRAAELALEAQLEDLASQLTDTAVHLICALEKLGQQKLNVAQGSASAEKAPQDELPF